MPESPAGHASDILNRDVTTSAEGSLWLQTTEPSAFPALERDEHVDVAILGGGITGLTTALLLTRDGARVAVIEAARVGSGVTGCTTAKASALQQTIYQQLRNRHGRDGAAAYAKASAAGVELLAELVREEQIECDLERRPAFTYAAAETERSSVEDEHEAAVEAGLPVRFVERIDLPFPTHGAVCLDDQIQIHPVRYVQGLAHAVVGAGSFVAEQTRAMGVDAGDPCKVRTERGTVTAQQVVVATHYPLLDRGFFFARLEPQRSYCIAAQIDGALPASMSISAGTPTRSIRSYGDLLIVGGEGHTTGARSATPKRYERLEEFTRRHWDLREVSHRWSAQDPVSWDQLPVVGPYHPGSTRLFVVGAARRRPSSARRPRTDWHLSRYDRAHTCGVCAVHASGVPIALQRRRSQLGLSLPWLALRRGWRSARGARDEIVRTQEPVAHLPPAHRRNGRLHTVWVPFDAPGRSNRRPPN